MDTTLERRFATRPAAPARGLALLASGHRLFFLGLGVSGVAAMLAWLIALHGALPLDAAWHGHEMVFGFACAGIGGFLSAAVPKWTGTGLFKGAPAAGLFALWLLGRVAMWSGVATMVDLLFLPVLAGAIGKRLLRSGNRRNYQVVGVLAGLCIANVAYHLGATTAALRLAVLLVAALLALIAGRIVPGFTRNALMAAGKDGDVVVRVERLDSLALPGVLLAAVADLVAPLQPWTGVVWGVVGLGLVAQGARWGLRHTLRIPIVAILQLAWWFLPLGMLLGAAAALAPLVGGALSPTTALHALTAGAIGGMLIAVATRAARGHAGLPLVAGPWTTLAYALVLSSALLRVALGTPAALPAGLLWAAGWAVFSIEHAGMLLRPRRDGLPG